MSLPVIVSVASLLVAVTGLFLSRRVTRKVQVRVHRAAFVDPFVMTGTLFQLPPTTDCYFINVTNVSLNREVEITHVWFDCLPQVHVLRPERPLPKRLKADETWETWLATSDFPPEVTEEEIYKLARVRLSTGKTYSSSRNTTVPSYGTVPGGNAPKASTGTP